MQRAPIFRNEGREPSDRNQTQSIKAEAGTQYKSGDVSNPVIVCRCRWHFAVYEESVYVHEQKVHRYNLSIPKTCAGRLIKKNRSNIWTEVVRWAKTRPEDITFIVSSQMYVYHSEW